MRIGIEMYSPRAYNQLLLERPSLHRGRELSYMSRHARPRKDGVLGSHCCVPWAWQDSSKCCCIPTSACWLCHAGAV